MASKKQKKLKTYDIAIVVSMEAKNYDDALDKAVGLAASVKVDNAKLRVVEEFEHDNEGQRVLYLHNDYKAYKP